MTLTKKQQDYPTATRNKKKSSQPTKNRHSNHNNSSSAGAIAMQFPLFWQQNKTENMYKYKINITQKVIRRNLQQSNDF